MDSNKLNNIIKYAVYALGLIGAIMLIRVLTADAEALDNDVDVQSSIVAPFVSYSVIMLYLTAILAVAFSILNIIKNPEALKKVGISVAILLVLFGIGYALADDAAITGAGGVIIEGGEQGSTSKMVGALLQYTYVLGFVGIAAVIWGAVKGMLSNN